MPTISIWLTDEEAAQLDALAAREKRSRSNMVSLLVVNESRKVNPAPTLPPPAPMPVRDGVVGA